MPHASELDCQRAFQIWNASSRYQFNSDPGSRESARLLHSGLEIGVEIHRERQGDLGEVRRRQDTDPARLDPARQRVRGPCQKRVPDPAQEHAVVRDEVGSERHHPQAETRLAASGRAEDNQAVSGDADDRGVEAFFCAGQGGSQYDVGGMRFAPHVSASTSGWQVGTGGEPTVFVMHAAI